MTNFNLRKFPYHPRHCIEYAREQFKLRFVEGPRYFELFRANKFIFLDETSQDMEHRAAILK